MDRVPGLPSWAIAAHVQASAAVSASEPKRMLLRRMVLLLAFGMAPVRQTPTRICKGTPEGPRSTRSFRPKINIISKARLVIRSEYFNSKRLSFRYRNCAEPTPVCRVPLPAGKIESGAVTAARNAERRSRTSPQPRLPHIAGSGQTEKKASVPMSMIEMMPARTRLTRVVVAFDHIKECLSPLASGIKRRLVPQWHAPLLARPATRVRRRSSGAST